MRIQIDHDNALPIYVQVGLQIKWEIATGRLGEGDPLPSVRQLALELRVNPNTVVKAYNELEHEGLVDSQHGRGTFVAPGARARVDSGRAQVREALRRAVRMAREAGLSRDTINQLLREALQDDREEA